MIESNTKEIKKILEEQTKILIAIHKSIINLSKLFEKYDTEYQLEIENQGDVQLG